MNFKDQIKNPRWQKRRLEIMQKDDFTCQMCGRKDRTLNVHHFRYIKGRMYWDYSDNELITICEKCHEYEHSSKDNLDDSFNDLKKSFAEHGLSNLLLESIISCLYPEVIINDTDEHKDGSKQIVDFIKYNICGSQCVSDIYALQRLGVDVSDIEDDFKKYGLMKDIIK